jgi:hypothetical protein
MRSETASPNSNHIPDGTMSDLMIHSNYSGKDGDSPKEACQ